MSKDEVSKAVKQNCKHDYTMTIKAIYYETEERSILESKCLVCKEIITTEVRFPGEKS